MDFLALVRERLGVLHMDESLLKRGVNVGFSGGEKKRNEIFQLALMEPKLAILDETDSGLDIDALKDVARGVNALRSPERSTILVTHYQRMLDHIVPDRVHVLSGGRIAASGGGSLPWSSNPGDTTGCARRRRPAHERRRHRHRPVRRRLRRARVGASRRPPRVAARRAARGDGRVLAIGLSDAAQRALEVHQRIPHREALVRPRRALLPRRARRRSGGYVPKGCASPCLVFVDGRVDRELSDVRALPPGVRIEDFTRVVEHDSGFLEGRLGRIVSPEKTAFTALNAAFMDAGAVVRVAPDTDAGAPGAPRVRLRLARVRARILSPDRHRGGCALANRRGRALRRTRRHRVSRQRRHRDRGGGRRLGRAPQGAAGERRRVPRGGASGRSSRPAPRSSRGRCRSEPGSRATTST